MKAQRVLLVDGYNVLNRIPEVKPDLDSGLEGARTKLALLVSRWARDHPGSEGVIIFDGDFRFPGSHEQRLAGLRCIFTRTPHGGDDEIIRFVRGYQGRKSDITVVTDDNYVRNNCRAHGAAVQPSSFIMARKARPSRGPADGKGIDRKAAAEIDQELKKKFGL